MALNKEYFDSIHIDVVKKKYYNANKVEAVFSDIRRQAEELNEENEQLRTQLAAINSKKYEIGDAVLMAQSVYTELVGKAKEKAGSIVEEAEEEKKHILQEARAQQEYAVQRVEKCYSKIKQQHMSCIEAINSEWQEFLCGLYPDEAADIKPEEKEETPCLSGGGSEITAADIEEKINAIAKELFEE